MGVAVEFTHQREREKERGRERERMCKTKVGVSKTFPKHEVCSVIYF